MVEAQEIRSRTTPLSSLEGVNLVGTMPALADRGNT